MEPSVSIARLGFRKWYERQLIDAHLALVTCVLCMVLAAALLEAFTLAAPLVEATGMMAGVLGAGYVGIRCWLRYQRVMVEAWRYGECAVCRKCSTYGRLKVLNAGAFTPTATRGEPAPAPQPWMNVACKKCGHTWRMPD